MDRFFCSSENITKETICLTDASSIHHLIRVVRHKKGDTVIIFDQRGFEYSAEIEEISSKNIKLKIREKFENAPGNKIMLSIACAIPKKTKMDDIVDKLTQLGVERIIPLRTERVIVKFDPVKAEAKLKRWKKIVQEALRQSQRASMTLLAPITDIRDLLNASVDYDLKLIPTLSGERKPLKTVMMNQSAKNILVLIGPEGDFSQEEIKLAIGAGCIPISLGKSVLRVDTAAVSAASFIKLYAND